MEQKLKNAVVFLLLAIVIFSIGFLVARNTMAQGNTEIYTRDQLSELINTQKSDIDSTTETFNNSGSSVKIYVDNEYVQSLDANTKYAYDHSECGNGETVKFYSYDRSIEIAPLNSDTKCSVYLNEQEPVYNYGDGTNNTKVNAYNRYLYRNGRKEIPGDVSTGTTDILMHSGGNFFGNEAGNFAFMSGYPITNLITYDNLGKDKKILYSGLNNYNFTTNVLNNDTMLLTISGGNTGGTYSYSGLKFKINGSYYTLQQMVANNYVKPLVLLSTYGVTRTTWGSAIIGLQVDLINTYSGGATGSSTYPTATYYIMSNTTITGFQINMSKTLGENATDGALLRKTSTNNLRFTINEW